MAIGACESASADAEELDECERCARQPEMGLEVCLYDAVHDDRHIIASVPAWHS